MGPGSGIQVGGLTLAILLAEVGIYLQTVTVPSPI